MLPPNEWHRLDATWAREAWRSFDPETTTVLVVESADRIVAHATTFWELHLEGVWIDPSHRGSAAVGRHLLRGIRNLTAGREVAAMVMNEASRQLVLGIDPNAIRLDCDHYAFRV